MIPPCVLALNGGSSSIRFAVYEAEKCRLRLSGKIERIGLPGTTMSFCEVGGSPETLPVPPGGHPVAIGALLDWLEVHPAFESVKAVGHRIVHGMKHTKPEEITEELLDELHQIAPYDPDHLPQELKLIEAFQEHRPSLRQIACFDTAFHRTMPLVARLLPIPRRYLAEGVERYGFHGISYSYLMEELTRLDPAASQGRVILAHLGNGASLAAVKSGKSIDTSMGFTPAAGLVMSTRSGDLDPGLLSYLSRTEDMTPTQFQKMVNHESGLLGISETSSDLRDLLKLENEDTRAQEAIELFCYQIRKWIGSFAAALGGLDTLVFSGGIGENSPVIRERICTDLGFLGIGIESSRNESGDAVISGDGAPVNVRVIPTNEELMIARTVSRMLQNPE